MEIPERWQSGHRGCEAVGGRLLAVGNAVGAGVGVWECLWGRVRAGVLGGRGVPPPLQAIPCREGPVGGQSHAGRFTPRHHGPSPALWALWVQLYCEEHTFGLKAGSAYGGGIQSIRTDHCSLSLCGPSPRQSQMVAGSGLW